MAEGAAERGVVCCWTGTGASIAANKVAGVRAALCIDAETARGARKYNHANVLALSLRSPARRWAGRSSEAFLAEPDGDEEFDLRNVELAAGPGWSAAELRLSSTAVRELLLRPG